MKKTDIFFVISNYNTDPEKYLEYCNNYYIYDQSDNVEIIKRLKDKYNNIRFVENSGHSITNYFRFFIDYYDSLPQYMMLAKANMIGRHISQEYFDRVFDNKCFTSLYDDRSWKDKCGIAYQLYDGAFLEINNAWYAAAKPHKYFETYNDLLSFVFKNPIIPHWLLFSPGACYIVTREQVLKYPKAFYENLKYLVSYTYFPSEAYHVERMLNIIFNANYEIKPYMGDSAAFYGELEKYEKIKDAAAQKNPVVRQLFNRLKKGLKVRINRVLHKMMIK